MTTPWLAVRALTVRRPSDGWQSTIAGDQEVRKALRQTLYVQFKIRDNDVFEKALGYVREYY